MTPATLLRAYRVALVDRIAWHYAAQMTEWSEARWRYLDRAKKRDHLIARIEQRLLVALGAGR